MIPTNTRDPNHFHKVVDCQWACPAHTNVPEYIRLIAQGRYTDAYMVNRQSNVFPGILGRTCDRPCEPACRRGRVDGEPVAICRLKRVAADNKDDIRARLPKVPSAKNGKRVALVGAGPASLTVANDLLPLGYKVSLFEKLPKAGGLMRSNIPAFRLPGEVIDEETGYILDMGVEAHFNKPVDSLRQLLATGFDAVFIGSGAPRGKELSLPGREEAGDRVHVGIDWLESVAFGHLTSVGERVIIIGVGNTAMDCCRTSRRLGGKDIKVMARRPRAFFKASPWELEDAEEEQVEIIVNHAPREFVVRDGKLQGMIFDRLEWSNDERGRLTRSHVLEQVFIPADDVILAIGQEPAFPWIERDLGIDFGEDGLPEVDETTFMSRRDGVFFGGDAAFGPKNIIWAVEQGHQAAISIDLFAQGKSVRERPGYGMHLASQKMSIHQWSYSNDYDPSKRAKMQHVDLVKRFERLNVEVELGYTPEQTTREVERCLNCDMQTVFSEPGCIECDACIDVCPLSCLTITPDGDEPEVRANLTTPPLRPEQPLFVSLPLKQTGRIMVKDEDLCVHCGLCAERCPTSAWDMQKSLLLIPYAGKPA